MAEFLIRHGIADRIYKIIDEAQIELVLISPYIRLDKETKDRLTERRKPRGFSEDTTRVNVICREKDLYAGEKTFLESIGVKLVFRKDLHAKCYLNEKEALVASMNLYEHSQENNDEMGLLVTKEGDRNLYDEIYKQAMRWNVSDNEPEVAKKKVGANSPTRNATPKPKPAVIAKPTKGFCIRCKADLPANPERPYCPRHYASWRRHENYDYEDKLCHLCGNPHAATMAKPLCPACYKEHAKSFAFSGNS